MSIYPDITFITRYVELWFGYKRIMIVDLDAHQGNGHERDHMDRLKYCVFDIYNHSIYPGDTYAKQAISYDIDAPPDDQEYLERLSHELPKAFDEFKPDFVVYNAGSDCLAGDPLGNLSLTADAIIKRDELVFETAVLKYKVPIVMLLSGGFCHANAPCIVDSITNLVSKCKLKLPEKE